MKASAPELVGTWRTLDNRIPSQRSSSSQSSASTLATSKTPSQSTEPATAPVAATASLDAILESAMTEPTTRCSLCRKFPSVVALLDRWMERRIAGELLDLDLKALYKTAKKLNPNLPAIDTLRRHCQNCRTENYEKVRAGE